MGRQTKDGRARGLTIVYTTIFGGSDSLKPAPAGADLCLCVTDRPLDYSHGRAAHGWRIVKHDFTGDPRRAAWHVRCLPNRYIPEYDRIIWIDASFTLTDLPLLLKHAGTAPIAALRHHTRKSCYEEADHIVTVGQGDQLGFGGQLSLYRNAGFNPSHLSISCVIVRDRSGAVQRFNETWNEHIQRYPSDNTQVSLDYSAWVNGLEIAALKGTRHKNPYAVHDHEDHKKRRKPYAKGVAA